jgi:hypothetical protein
MLTSGKPELLLRFQAMCNRQSIKHPAIIIGSITHPLTVPRLKFSTFLGVELPLLSASAEAVLSFAAMDALRPPLKLILSGAILKMRA